MSSRKVAPAAIDPFAPQNPKQFVSEDKANAREVARLRQQLSNDQSSVGGDPSFAHNKSVAFAHSDGRSLDIGDGEDMEQDEDDRSDSEEERVRVYGEGANDAKNGLSSMKMLAQIELIHPRVEIVDEVTQQKSRKQRPVCGTKTGSHSCCSRKSRESELAEYGVGSVLYFQFLKYMACLFIVMLVLAVPAMLFYFQGTELPDIGMGSIVTATSLGNLGSSKPVCKTAIYDLLSADATLSNPQVSLQLSCPFGELYTIKDFGQLSTNAKVDCEAALADVDNSADYFNYYPPDCYMDNFVAEEKLKFETMFQEQCKGKSKCQFQFQQYDLPESTCTLPSATAANWKYVLLAKCSSSTVRFGSAEVKITKNVIGMMAVGSDLLITFIFWCSMLSLKKLQRKGQQEILGDTVVAQDFTVVVSQRPHVEKLEDLPGVYYAWAENICSQEVKESVWPGTDDIDENQNNVWNVNLGLTNLGYLEYMKKMGTLLVNKKKLDKKLKMLNKQKDEGKNNDGAIEDLKVKIKELQKKAKDILKQGNSYKETNPASCRYAYVQFQSMSGREKFLKAMDINSCKRCWLRCQGKQDGIAHKYLGGKWPEVKAAPDPTLIMWQNLGKGSIERCGRSTISNVVAFILLLVGFVFIVYLFGVRDSLASTVVCGEQIILLEDAELQWIDQETLVSDINYCFCLQEFGTQSIGVKEIAFPDGTLPCEQWFDDYALTQTIGTLVSVSITLINTILRTVLRKSSNFEGHHSVTGQLASAFSKMWVVQFVNTAVILIIVNNNIGGEGILGSILEAVGLNGLLFNGSFSDFTTEWYSVVGVAIFTTAFINGITPLGSIAAWFLAGCKRCCDRGCSCDQKKTKKVLQMEYETVYTGTRIQYDNRLSVIIAMIWVIMMFSAALPILYFAGFILCLTTYWTDKMLFLRFYRLPPRHGSDLINQARNIIEWSLVLHLGVGIYMLSNPDIFTSEEDDNQAVAFLQGYAKVISGVMSAITGVESARFGQVHIVFYSVGTGLFTILFIIEKITGGISSCVNKLCCCCMRKDEQPDIFSNDLYKDISKANQHKEYAESKKLQKEISNNCLKDPHNEFSALRNYYKQRMQLKVKTIRYNLLCALSMTQTEKGSLRDTKSAFFHLQKEENADATKDLFYDRMAGLYSYNVLDSEEFRQAKKIERRIGRYDKKMREKMARDADRLRTEALTNIQSAQTQIQGGNGAAPAHNLSQALANKGMDDGRDVM